VINVWHVETDGGAVYGVAATGKRDALLSVTERIARDGDTYVPTRCERMTGKLPATWSYGMVIRYR
jgi:hypothetical protein